jgi:predicted component of type VI protein secretion system
MIIPQKHFAVNWTDGMKVNKEHFIDQEEFFKDALRDAASLTINRNNYGLLPALHGSGSPFSYEVFKATANQLRIRVRHCQAITPAGVRISISGEGLTVNAPIESSATSNGSGSNALADTSPEYFYIILVVNSFERTLIGEPDPEEIPIRHPYTQPACSIQLARADLNIEHLSGYHLVIGRIVRIGEDFSKDEHFIPPCATISSSESLMEHYHDVVGYMTELQRFSRLIMDKIHSQKQQIELAHNARMICLTILDFTSRHDFYFRNMAHQESPVFLINALSSFAGLLNNGLRMLPEKERMGLLNYITKWCDATPKSLTDNLEEVIEIDYRHHQTHNNLSSIRQLLQRLLKIWQVLSRLEFIGQEMESIIVATNNSKEPPADKDPKAISWVV